MTTVREPILKPIKIADLRPTQITVGMREVKEKRKRWREKEQDKKKGAEFLGKHMIPVVVGPKDRPYVIDHHHLVRALHDEGVQDILITVVANLSRLEPDAFWFVMDNRNWMHPFDGDGRRRAYKDIPKSVDKLVDDPFRSLAGELRRAGGFAKDTTPFSEFLWADFLRRRIKRAIVEHDFDHALETALLMAKSEDANFLPGWCGAAPED
ncbi:MAG TPA: ParB-like protein [Xanthobacteraceae bacterium]|nr:ParB-like protein [Xanthobacteraceae bacterium]